nr:hypothetical protein GCM10020092_104750 [Actinoplanes digitatis]
MFVVPRPAASTDLTKTAANASATSAKAIATMTYVTFSLLRDTPPLSAARYTEVPDINVLLYAERTRQRTKPRAHSLLGETTPGPAERGTREQ